MEYNIVSGQSIVNMIKKSKYFKISLGFASTIDNKNGHKELSDNDKFAYFYNSLYKTTIYGCGYIGDINIYLDYAIQTQQLAIYFNKAEFVFDFDINIAKEKTIDVYLGSFLKKIEEKIEMDKVEKQIIDTKKVGNPNKLNPKSPEYSPGSVTNDDLKAYKEAKLSGKI